MTVIELIDELQRLHEGWEDTQPLIKINDKWHSINGIGPDDRGRLVIDTWEESKGELK